jgi:hypothetical protein
MALTLIDKQDTVEIVRDQIAAILTLEVANQMALASAASKDPNDFKLRIFTERSNPWDQFQNDPADRSPLVNVWWDTETFDKKASNSIERQKGDAVFNLDCYGYGKSSDNVAGGHNPGDKEAAFEAHRAVRLVRNIIMAAENLYLVLQGTVWGRFIQSITIFQPDQNAQVVQQIVAARIALAVSFNEFSPQVVAETLELLSVDVKRAENGEIVLEADYVYPI